MGRYFLPRWVHLCFTADGTVFLDIKQDRYIGLGPHQTSLLRDLISNAQRPGNGNDFAAELCRLGLLTTSTKDSRPLAPADLTVPREALDVSGLDEQIRITATHAINFLVACITAWIALRWRSLEYAMSRQQKNTERISKNSSSISHAEIQKLLRVYLYLRPFVHASRDHCLHNSFALAEFLRRYGISATCMFGVKTMPFSAHCWVQTDRFLVIDESPEEVAGFSPICSA